MGGQNYKLSNYEDVMIVDENGIIIFYDMANAILFDLKPEDILGKKITTLYKNLDDDTSTFMLALKYGKAICEYEQELQTKAYNTVYQIGSTFPIIINGKVLGAIEFSKYLYTKDSINYIQKHSMHKVYRKNNTLYTLGDIITNNPKMEAIKDRIKKISLTGSSVLIYGATGTGKEMIAQSIHNYGSRYSKPFISLNCAAIPQTLLESTLFGTTKGSYTGAEDSQGLFEAANQGTLFLDEINSVDPIVQVKLLKAIEEQQIRRVGSTKNINLDVKIIAALNQNPIQLIKEGKLRGDLFYRLSVVQIDLPLLKDRKEDIELLTNYFINYYNERLGMSITGISDELIKNFKSYDWPGNVRELKNVIEGAFNNTNDNIIHIRDVSERIMETTLFKEKNDWDVYDCGLDTYIYECEKKLIKEAIKNCNGNISEAARKLKISRQLLKYKIEKL